MILIYILFATAGHTAPVYETTQPGRCEAIAAQVGAPYHCETLVKP